MILIKYLQIIGHLVWGFWIVVFMFPSKSHHAKNTLLSSWSSRLLKILDIQLEVLGDQTIKLDSVLIVSNHISWLDIHVFNAWHPMRFVAKREVANWPVFGWFAKKLNTLFIDREKRGHSKSVSEQMTNALLNGDRICIFPEGTSSDGTTVLEFKSNLFQAVLDANCHCLPIAISYINPANGEKSSATAFIGDMGLLESIKNTLMNSPIIARVHIGVPIKESEDRKELALMAWRQVANLSS